MGALLVVGDERRNKALADELVLDGFQVRRSGFDALSRNCGSGDIDLIVLGPTARVSVRLDVLRALRAGELGPEAHPVSRVLWISSGDELSEVLRAFEAGADDVIRPAFVYREFVARVRALLRREVRTVPTVIRCEELEVDMFAHRATLEGTLLDLRRLEYALLVHLAGDPRRVFAKEELLQEVWGFRSQGATRTVESHASRLRRKLEACGNRRWVVNTWGIGYSVL